MKSDLPEQEGATVSWNLPPGRLEEGFTDKAPLYTAAEAKVEANRCLFCYDAPCTAACPTSIDVPRFIKKISSGNILGSARTILEANLLGYSCSRVCPVDVLCVGACVYNKWNRAPIQIGRLQRYATETAFTLDRPILVPGTIEKDAGRKLTHAIEVLNGAKVAHVGAGPASLSCAGYLALAGVEAVIFEGKPFPGGLNTTGIAPYKMQALDALHEVEFIRSLGVTIRTAVPVGRDLPAEKLLSEHDAVFLGLGLGRDSRLGIPGDDGDGIIGAVELIERIKSDPSFRLPEIRRALVIGGGNTTIDAARELIHLGVPEVTIVYRRTRGEMPGYDHELKEARAEGVGFIERTVPVAVLRSGSVLSGLQVARAEKRKAVPGTEHELPADLVVTAIGQGRLSSLISLFPGVEVDSRGNILVDPITGRTGNPKVYAGGDCANGGKEVVHAVADGFRAARAILSSLTNAEPGSTEQTNAVQTNSERTRVKQARVKEGGNHG